MALTEKKKQEIIESHKRLAQEKFDLRQDTLERIMRKYNLERINILRKSRYLRETEKEEIEKKDN